MPPRRARGGRGRVVAQPRGRDKSSTSSTEIVHTEHQEEKQIDSSSSSVPPSYLSPSTPASSSSDSPPFSSTHDVFPSFCGEDVRQNFLSHIQKEFQRKGITTFMDNGIKRGESIGTELIRAIRGSKIAIILLSRNYASSKWCLDELGEIIKCRKELGQTVMAIFYKVNPSDVRKMVGDFGKVFTKTCAGKTEENIRRWKQALVEVSEIAGYDSSTWDSEAVMIERIATDVSNELISSVPSNDFEDFVGRKAHLENMEPFLHLSSNEVRMIGIWGPSGIGKSTIARFLYKEYSHGFQLSVFMENIKERYPKACRDDYSAKLQLQAEFLSEILNQKDMKIHHLGVAKDRLKNKKVLVVLDDVDQLAQLDAMAKETHWFGPGSRIIITTQDKSILNAHGVDHIYEVDFPAYDEALQIFCMYAFSQTSPCDGFENLARDVTKLSGKLPLGLRVMGSYFKRRPKLEWIREQPRLRTSGIEGEIENILMFSFNGLCNQDKDLFLHIACMFNNEGIEKVEEHLLENFVDVTQGLHILAEKSVLSIRSGYVKMHDLLVRLGREIVCKQSIREPGKRQFLVDARDIRQALRNTTDCTSLIGINSEYSTITEELCTSETVFERMSNLQFLRLYGDASDL